MIPPLRQLDDDEPWQILLQENSKNAPSSDSITNKHLCDKLPKFLTYIINFLNSILKLKHFPTPPRDIPVPRYQTSILQIMAQPRILKLTTSNTYRHLTQLIASVLKNKTSQVKSHTSSFTTRCITTESRKKQAYPQVSTTSPPQTYRTSTSSPTSMSQPSSNTAATQTQ